jgi:hypothetical protein
MNGGVKDFLWNLCANGVVIAALATRQFFVC